MHSRQLHSWCCFCWVFYVSLSGPLSVMLRLCIGQKLLWCFHQDFFLLFVALKNFLFLLIHLSFLSSLQHNNQDGKSPKQTKLSEICLTNERIACSLLSSLNGYQNIFNQNEFSGLRTKIGGGGGEIFFYLLLFKRWIQFTFCSKYCQHCMNMNRVPLNWWIAGYQLFWQKKPFTRQ